MGFRGLCWGWGKVSGIVILSDLLKYIVELSKLVRPWQFFLAVKLSSTNVFSYAIDY